nr:MAG TPA: MAEBL protein [Caudoviricetes sp.]
MPLKKKRISEMNEANDMKGFFTIGYRIVNGVKTSLKFGLEKIQTALDNMLKATSDAKTATTDMRQLEATVEGNESTRETAESRRNASEQSRVTAETGRSSAETKRVQNEDARKTEEAARITAEGKRVTAETGRTDAESKRVSDEQIRKGNEDARKTAETGRSSAETARVTAEGKRATAETGRVDAESGRVTAEGKRKADEVIRGNNESARVSAESTRSQSETTRINAENARKTTEEARVSAETKRATAETARATAESGRSSSETIRVQNENARKSTEDARKVDETNRAKAEVERVKAEEARKAEYGGIVDEMNQATEDATAQLGRVKTATDNANAAATLANQKATLAGEKAALAATAAGSVNAAKDAATTAANNANAAKTASEAQTALAKKATDDANAAKNASVTQTGLAKKATDDANAAAIAANNAVSGVDAKVQAAIDKLVAGAPDALDTLIELANALGNDPNFATTMAKELGKKLNASDIVNNLTSGGAGKALSAEQGKALKAALDSHNHDSRYEKIITKLTAFNKDFGTAAGTVCQGNDSRLSDARTPKAHTHKKADISDFPTSMPASDVPAWAKAASKPTYTASEVGASPSGHNHTGTYEPAFTKNTAFNKNFGSAVGTVCEGNDIRLSDARTPKAHTHKKADISDFPTSMPASDVPAWAKTSSKPTYTASEVGASPSNHNHTGVYQPAGSYAASGHKHGATDITPDSTHRFVTDVEKNTWNGKAAGNHDHDSVYQPKGSYAPASHTHAATQVNEDATHRFVTDSDKTNWNGKAAGNHNHAGVYQPAGSYASASHKHAASDINEDETHRFFTDDERTKLDGVESGANNYSHPASHPASIITESSSRRFMTDTEKKLLSTLGTNAILLEGDNLGQNGYVKYSNGFLIQWGYSSSSSNATYIYLPTSFYNTNYCVTITFIEPGNGMNIVSPLVTLKNTSNFRMRSRYAVGNANGTGEGTNPFGWIAVGRWK